MPMSSTRLMFANIGGVMDKDKKRVWKSINIDKERAYHRKSYKKNLSYYKRYCEINRDHRNEMILNYQKRNLDSWRPYFDKRVSCEICGRKVKFSSGVSRDSIHFDHRNGGNEAIKGIPMTWFRGHLRTDKNEKILESCNFGILCFRCNKFLPTKDRGKWLKNVNRYYEASKI